MSYQTLNECQASNTISNTQPSIILPFPPIIKASDIVNKRQPSRVKSKSPNAFLIYRKAFLDQLSISNHNLKMTDVSKLVSNHWRNEAEFVKDAYRKIAQEVEIELDEKRKTSDTIRIVWKNSKYSARKQNKIGKTTKTRRNKSEFNAKFKAATVSLNVDYQFVPEFPEAEFASKSSDTDVISTPNTETLYASPENYQNSYFNELINYQETNDNLEFNQTYLQFTQDFTNFNGQLYGQLYEQQEYHENVDWYLQNFIVY